MINNIVLSNVTRKQISIVPDSFTVELQLSGGCAYLGGLIKKNWHIWQIQNGYQAARLIDGRYRDHHSLPLSNNKLESIAEAVIWVDKQIESGKE